MPAPIARIHVETWRSTYPGMLPDKTLIDMTIDDKAQSWRRTPGAARERGRGARRRVRRVAVPWDFASAGHNRHGSAALRRRDPDALCACRIGRIRVSGAACSKAASAPCARRGFASAVVWVLAENPARFFYERMGGKRAGERDEALWGAVLREIAYGWSAL